VEVPVLADLAKNFLHYRNPEVRYPFGMLHLSNKKLRNTGFVFPEGVNGALNVAIARFRSQVG
jgi:hypothetical protein